MAKATTSKVEGAAALAEQEVAVPLQIEATLLQLVVNCDQLGCSWQCLAVLL
jgi:hypothetical protein